MGITFPAITFRAPSQRHETTAASSTNAVAGQSKKPKRKNSMTEQRQMRRWWTLCKGKDSKPSSLGVFLEVEPRFGEEALYEIVGTVRNGWLLFANGRVLPPPSHVDDGSSSIVGSVCRCPILLAGISR